MQTTALTVGSLFTGIGGGKRSGSHTFMYCIIPVNSLSSGITHPQYDKAATMPRTHNTCKICGNGFDSYNLNPQYCSRTCKAESQSVQIDPETVEHFYWWCDMTQKEIADQLGTSQKVIHSLMRRHGIETRTAKKRNQTGPNNDSWKGDEAGYQAFHLRVSRMRGKPQKCSACSTEDPDKNYDWANMTGDYSDIWDYKRLCRSCHAQHDHVIYNIKHMRRAHDA